MSGGFESPRQARKGKGAIWFRPGERKCGERAVVDRMAT